MNYHWLKSPRSRVRTMQLDFDSLTPGELATGTAIGGVPVSITRAGTNVATYWDGAAWQTCGANTLRITPDGLLVEPTRTQRYPTPSAPAAGTTASLGTGTWIFWVEGSGSQAISAGTAVGTGWGTASAGNPVTLTITSAGTASLAAVTGSLSRAQIEGTGAFSSSFIPTAAARGGDVITLPVTFGAGMNQWAVSGYYQLNPGRAWTNYGGLWQMGGSSGPNTAWLTVGGGSSLLFSVINGANEQKYRSISMVPPGDVGYGTVPRRFTAIQNNGTLRFFIDDVETAGTLTGGGFSGLWSAAPSTLTLGNRNGATDAFGGFVRKFGVMTGSADVSRALAMTWPADSYRLATIGDSITWGAYTTSAYPTVLKATFGEPWLVANHGVSSDTTTLMLGRWNSTIKALHYGTVVYLGGINDIRLGQSLATAQANTTTILAEAKAAGARVMALTLLPAGGSAGWDAAKETNRDNYNAWLAALCVSEGYVCVDSASDFEDGATGNMKAAYDSGDHIHPGQAGADRLAALVYAGGQTAGWWP